MAVTQTTTRKQMTNLLIQRGIQDERVLRAMSRVPRERFVPARLASEAYSDKPLPIGHGQTISQPYIVALMSEALGCRDGARILEIGTGSGYQAAVLAEMGMHVWTLEYLDILASHARRRLRDLNYSKVTVLCMDGNDGWVEEAPYDAVLVSAASQEIPRAPYSQLRQGGCMVLPMGSEECQELVKVSRLADGVHEEYLGACRFVKLVGRHGWET